MRSLSAPIVKVNRRILPSPIFSCFVRNFHYLAPAQLPPTNFNLKRPVLILDGSSIVYQICVKTNADSLSPVDMATEFVEDTIKRFNCAKIIGAFDCASSKASRKAIFPDYKNNRDPDKRPQNLESSTKDIQTKWKELGVECVQEKHAEADDVIATFAKSLCLTHQFNSKHDIVVIAIDKDLLQTCTKDRTVQVYQYNKAKLLNWESVLQIYGVTPMELPLFFAIAGNATNCIPGLKGIGLKGAATLINKFRSVSGLPTDTMEGIILATKEELPAAKKFLQVLEPSTAINLKKFIRLTNLYEHIDLTSDNLTILESCQML
eukprot:Filipodium_phascolosomae@DN3806_c0_g1_i1.p1